MLKSYHRRTGILAYVLVAMLNISCAEEIVLPGEDTGEWVSVLPLREVVRSQLKVMTEGDDGELYVGGSSSGSEGTGLVLFTDDAGVNWDLRGKGMNPGKDIVNLVIMEDGMVFAAMDRAGVFRSTDRGMTWVQVNNHLHDLNVVSLEKIPDGRLLVSTNDEGLFFSSDRGDSWVPCLSDSVFQNGMHLESDYDRGIVYATRSGVLNVFYSDDNCSTWHQMPEHGESWIHDLRIDAGGDIYLSNYFTLLKYMAVEKEWIDITPEADYLFMDDFTIDDEGRLYVVQRDHQVLWSDDRGSSWQEKDWQTYALVPSRIFFHRGYLFLSETNFSSILYRSGDEGSSWQSAGLEDSYFLDLLVDSSGGMIGRTHFRLYRKGQADDLWTLSWAFDEGCWQENFPNSVRMGLCPDGDILFSMCGLTRVPGEGGPVHRIMGEDTLVISIEIDPAGMIFLSTDNGVMRSLDNGESWETVLPELPMVLEIEANVDSTVYLATEYGLVISRDYGTTWETQIDSTVVTAIASDADGLIYAGVEGGIMFSADRGCSWEMFRFEGYLETARTLAMSSGGRVVALTNHRVLYLVEKGCAGQRVIFSELPAGIKIMIGEDGYLYHFYRQLFRYSVPVDML